MSSDGDGRQGRRARAKSRGQIKVGGRRCLLSVSPASPCCLPLASARPTNHRAARQSCPPYGGLLPEARRANRSVRSGGASMGQRKRER